MARAKTQFVCQSCGATHARWAGRCDACGGWNTVAEDAAAESAPIGGKAGRTTSRGRSLEFVSLDGESPPAPRRKTGIQEFDRVTGGGLVRGSATLIGGDPGIGKSTLLLQAVAGLAKDARCVYISGEEAIHQIRMRAVRLGVEKAPVSLTTATNVGDILATLDVDEPPDIVVIDSIQTMYVNGLDSAPGAVGQVRASAQELIRLAKRRNFAILFVGHVTKDGVIAGPRVLEHMVDTVMYFEGERGHHFRILRAVKNRFGPTDEIGV
ncbi:MAG: DNA repair protein RadA, partial [Alphaproteobacteria bacterium]|nr:DNA repair protein RadA [Alphaproteobacteria bacterium]